MHLRSITTASFSTRLLDLILELFLFLLVFFHGVLKSLLHLLNLILQLFLFRLTELTLAHLVRKVFHHIFCFCQIPLLNRLCNLVAGTCLQALHLRQRPLHLLGGPELAAPFFKLLFQIVHLDHGILAIHIASLSDFVELGLHFLEHVLRFFQALCLSLSTLLLDSLLEFGGRGQHLLHFCLVDFRSRAGAGLAHRLSQHQDNDQHGHHRHG